MKSRKKMPNNHMQTNQNVVVFILAYNEENTIGRIVNEIAETYPVIIVDDGSTDKTMAEAIKAGATKTIRHERNLGLYHAFLDAFKLTDKNDVVVTIDGDGQHDPADIKRLVEKLHISNADIAIGSRNKKVLIEWFYESLFSLIIRLITGIRVHDPSCGLRAIKHDILSNILPVPKRFGFHQEMLSNALLKRYQVVEVPINVHKRIYGSSRIKRNPWVHLRFVLSVLSVLLKKGLSKRPRASARGIKSRILIV